MKQIPYRRPTYIRRHHTEFSRPEFVYRCVTPNSCSFVFCYLTNSACSKACLCKKQDGTVFRNGKKYEMNKKFRWGSCAKNGHLLYRDACVRKILRRVWREDRTGGFNISTVGPWGCCRSELATDFASAFRTKSSRE
jgi:hypothetical protein